MAKKPLDIKALRRKLGLNQHAFWQKLGVSQSGGSRYETGRNIPLPIRMLICMFYLDASTADLLSGKLANKARKGL